MDHNRNILKSILIKFSELYNKIPRHIQISQRYGLIYHPIWLMGNTIYNMDKCGVESVLPEWWSTKFSNESRPLPLLTLYPNNDDMKSYWEIAIKNVDNINNIDIIVNTISTVGINIGKLMSYMDIHSDYIQIGEITKKAKERPLESVLVNDEASDKPESTKSEKMQEEGFQCPYCDRSFVKKFALSNHINNAHKDKK